MVQPVEYPCLWLYPQDYTVPLPEKYKSIRGTDKAHSLSDVVAWFNSHNIEPKGVIRKDLYSKILEQMQRESR